jgi:hypothetical protein
MTDEQKKLYQEKRDEQLREWVKGNPIHNDAGVDGGECCPDFSCCSPELLAPRKVREAFAAARAAGDQAKLNRMLGRFLGAMIKAAGHEVVTSADVRSEDG